MKTFLTTAHHHTSHAVEHYGHVFFFVAGIWEHANDFFGWAGMALLCAYAVTAAAKAFPASE